MDNADFELFWRALEMYNQVVLWEQEVIRSFLFFSSYRIYTVDGLFCRVHTDIYTGKSIPVCVVPNTQLTTIH